MTISSPWYGPDKVPRSAWLPYFNVREVGARHLLTNRLGDWELLSEEELRELFLPFTSCSLIERLAARGLVLYGDNAQRLAEDWSYYNSGFYGGPYLHIVHLTQRCNLACSYCHSAAIPLDAKGRDLTPEVASKIAGFILSSPSRRININFQGGEPTLMPQLIELIMSEVQSACCDSNRIIRASITTNGTLLSPEVIRVLEKYQISTTVSIDGPQKIHDQIRVFRDGSGSHEAAVSGREYLRNATSVPVSGSIMVLTDHNIKHLRSIIDEYVESGQRSIHLKPVTKLGFGKTNWDDLKIEFEEFWSAYIDAIEYMLLLLKQGAIISELHVQLALQKVIDRRNPTYVDFRNPCGLVYGVLNYDIDGKIYACHEGKRRKEFLLGSVDDDSTDVLMSSKALDLSGASVLDRNAECRSCAYLPYCGPCPASSYQSTGSKEIVPHKDFQCLFTLRLFDWVFKKLNDDPEPLLGWWRYQALGQIFEREAV